MMSLHMGAAGSLAGAKAMAEYLLEQQIPQEAMRAAAYYGQTAGVEEAIAEGHGAAPMLRTDIDPALADALGLQPGQVISADNLAQILSGHRADGESLPVQHQHRNVETYGDNESEEGSVRHRVAYLDLTLSAPKHLSVAWAFAETEAERNSLLQAHRTARDETLRYIEQQIIRGRLGAGGEGGTEPGRAAWITVDHFTARPTQETIRTDPATGEVFTQLRSAKVAGDPAVHSHCLVPNLIHTQSGRFVAIDTAAFHGRIHEFGAVYQALLARELTALGVGVDLDPLTNMARIPAIPEFVVDEFSKRSREGEKSARAYAAREGRDWEALSAEQQAAFRKAGTHATRQDKETNTPDLDAWRDQAGRIGWKHRTVLGTGAQVKTRAERMDHADREGLPHLAEMLTKRAVIGQGDARLAVAKGFIAAGGLESTGDLGAMVKHWVNDGVVQDGQWTKLLWKEIERGKVRITTELHRDQETELIELARKAVADRRHALIQSEISAAVERSGVTYRDRHGNSQRAAVETLGTDGGLAVLVGVAGSGKSTGVLKPLVNGWQHRGLTVWGTAQAWRQAKDLRGAGIESANVRALDPFLEGIADGRTKIDGNSVVVLDEVGRIGTRQLLEALRLREKHGFKLVLIGDDKQATAIEAGPVVDLLRRALGEERIPQILETIRQAKTREQAIAGMWRKGEAAEAIAAKRADGTAELVPGGYRDAVERVADLYAERRKATDDRRDYRITISAPTNLDAHEIARVVRERRRAMGEVGADQARVAVTDGQGNGRYLDLAVGDRVRLFRRTVGVFAESGRRRPSVAGDNGSVLEIVAIDRGNGLRVKGESGKVAFVSWEALRDRGGTKRVLLAYGDVLTVDTAQGITSDEHIGAMPAGSKAVTGGKAYVAGSRHRVRHYLVGSMGAEMREAQTRRMSGLPQMTPQESTREAWANLTRNLQRQVEKESALTLLEGVAVSKRKTAQSLQGALRRHEAREAAGQSATTVRQTQAAGEVRKAVPEMAEGITAVAARQSEVAREVAGVAQSPRKSPPREKSRRVVRITEPEAQQQFADALRLHGLKLKGLPIMDGKLHYAPVEGNRGREMSGAYKGFYGDDRRPAGAVYNYKLGGFVGTWKARGETVPVSAEELARRAVRAAQRDTAHKRERLDRETAGAKTAAALIAAAKPADAAAHPYLVKKGVDAIGVYQDAKGRLLVPLRDIDGELRNVQTIAEDGTKLYLAGARKMGAFHLLGDLKPGEPVAIAEGYATAATVHRATGIATAVALDTSNLTAVALAFRQADPERPIYMAADNDHHLPLRDPPRLNVGKEKAEAAAAIVGARVLLAPGAPEQAAIGKGTDWNDYEARYDRASVKAALQIQMSETASPHQGEAQRAASQAMSA
jgi:conjugative relaxase-like TrwC/TraI family protein